MAEGQQYHFLFKVTARRGNGLAQLVKGPPCWLGTELGHPHSQTLGARSGPSRALEALWAACLESRRIGFRASICPPSSPRLGKYGSAQESETGQPHLPGPSKFHPQCSP